jgi:hypothetical protein
MFWPLVTIISRQTKIIKEIIYIRYHHSISEGTSGKCEH